jgi:predicted DNA-binding transcriptional regulator YafY
MPSTSTRLLRLLSLLQVRREWPAAELSARLDVDVRTIRRDVGRLRQLGYAIDASSGPGGGYRMSAGTATPPLLLEDDEAVAVAVALGAAAGSVAGVQDVALRLLAKLDQLLPRRLRRRLSAVPTVTISLPAPGATAGLNTLAAIAAACRDEVQLRFAYRDRGGAASTRVVEPMRLVHTGRRWYLAAWDLGRGDWRTFRVDRIDAESRLVPGPRFVPRTPPEDFATFVSKSLRAWPYRYRAKLRVAGSVADVGARVPSWVGTVEPIDDTCCAVTIGGDTSETLAAFIVHMGLEFTLLEPIDLAQPIREVADRLQRGVAAVPAFVEPVAKFPSS